MRRIVLLVFFAFFVVLVPSAPANAASLKMQPLIYNETLAKGETKKGFVDISNPTGVTLQLVASVQAFRQIDNNGSLEFYDNEQISQGISLDLNEFELGPREAIRVFFSVNSNKLPEGDIFAAIFVATKNNQESQGIAESVRLGTILTLVNGAPASRQAKIESLSAAFFHFGSVKGSYTVKNIADPETINGFYPAVIVSISPLVNSLTLKSSLVMAGKTRQVPFSFSDNRFGLYKLTASYENNEQSQWIFVISGIWQWLTPLLIGIVIIWFFLRHRNHKKVHFKVH